MTIPRLFQPWTRFSNPASGLPVLYRGVGGFGRKYVGKRWGSDAVLYATSNLELASIYGAMGQVWRVEVDPSVVVVLADSKKARRIADAADAEATARSLHVDAIYNPEKVWVNGITGEEFILFSRHAARLQPLLPAEAEKARRVGEIVRSP